MNARDADGDPLLYTAVWRDKTEALKILVDAGADVNAMDAEGDPLLHEAVWRGHTAIVSLLIEGGADVNAKDAGGDSMLQEAPFQEAFRHRGHPPGGWGHGVVAGCERESPSMNPSGGMEP